MNTSRKIEAASNGAAWIWIGAAQPLEVVHRVAGEDHEAEHRVDHVAAGNRDEHQHDPEHDQPEQREEGEAGDLREVVSRGVAVRTEAADEERGAPPACQSACGLTEA